MPWVGLPYVWFAEGRYLALLVAAAAVVSLLVLSPVRERRTSRDSQDDGDGTSGDTTGTDGATSPGDQPLATASQAPVTLFAVSALAIGLASGLVAPASATFIDTAVASASFTAGYWADPEVTDTTPVDGTESLD